MKTRTCAIGILSALMTLTISPGVLAQSYKVDWSAVDSGGGVMSGGNYRISGSIGQPAAAFAKSASVLHWAGFWAGDVPTPTVAPTLAAAKLLSDGTFTSVSGQIATSAEGDFSGFFYVEESSRSNGVRVAFPIGTVTGLVRGRSIVSVLGSMGTTATGERQIAALAIVITSTNPLAIEPLGMNNRTLGGDTIGVPPLGQYGVTNGFGLNNVGLLVATSGRVSYVDGVYMTISDGSNNGIRVSTAQFAIPLPNVGDYVSVIGLSSLYTSGTDRLPQILPRSNGDVK